MYREEILDLYRNPRNTGRLDDALEAEGENASCGDSTHFYVKIKDGEVADVKHETEGCAICTASNSILSDKIIGMDIQKLEKLDKDWMTDKLGAEISPMRIKCAVLGLKTVQKAIDIE